MRREEHVRMAIRHAADWEDALGRLRRAEQDAGRQHEIMERARARARVEGRPFTDVLREEVGNE
jgi:hypothetical protein